MNKLFGRLCDAIFITRPIILVPVWGYFLLGYYRASLAFHPASLVPVPLFRYDFPMLLSLPGHALLALVMLSCSVAATYILNQLVDIKTDLENGGLPLIAKAGVPLSLAHSENIVLTLIPIFYAFMQSRTAALFFLAALVINLAYNLKPLYFTGRPFLDFLSNALGFGMVAFGIGWISANSEALGSPLAFVVAALPYTLLMVSGSINSTFPDMEGDRRTGKITTMVYLGARRANLISLASVALALAIAIFNRDIIAAVTALVALPLFIKFQISGQRADGIRTFQIGGGFLMVMTIPVFPWFFLYGLITYLLTRLYFRLRHNVDYPEPGA
jgi:4-hydroxybenzoate polyprenyltransferase